MKHMNWWTAVLAVVLIVAWVPASRADTISVTLTDANQTVVQGTSLVTFDATISNPSSTDTIYLNGDSSVTDSLLVTIDDSPFLANAPLFLDPGASSGPFEIFDVNLPTNLAAGFYSGTFSVLGGADGGAGTAFDDLADVNFSVNVTPTVATPEPGIVLLLGSGLAGLLLFHKRTKTLS